MRKKFHITDHPNKREWVITREGFTRPLLRMACSIRLNADYEKFTLDHGDLAIFSSEAICRRCFQRTYKVWRNSFHKLRWGSF